MTIDVLGVDVGGTSIKVGSIDADGEIRRFVRVPTPTGRSDGAAVVDAVVDIVVEFAAEHTLRAVGVAVLGVVEEAAGVAVWSENLRWKDVPFGEALTRRLGVPVAIGHDVRIGGFAEHRVGACRGTRDAAFVPIGTGISAALILDGRIHSAGGFSGEIGHIDVGHDLPCACGAVGCLEAIASAAAVTRRYNATTDVELAGSREVAHRVRSGDPAAIAVWDEALVNLSHGLAVLASTVAPEVIAIGGGLAESWDLVAGPLVGGLKERLTFQRVPRVVAAELGDRAGCVGAGLRAWELVG